MQAYIAATGHGRTWAPGVIIEATLYSLLDGTVLRRVDVMGPVRLDRWGRTLWANNQG